MASQSESSIREIEAAKRRLEAAKAQRQSASKMLTMAESMEKTARKNKEEAQLLLNNSNAEIAAAEASLKLANSLAGRKRRTRFDLHQKIAILDEIDQKTSTQEAVLKKYGTTRQSVRRWDREKIQKHIDEQSRGTQIRIVERDGLKRVKDGLREFYESNDLVRNELNSEYHTTSTSHSMRVLCSNARVLLADQGLNLPPKRCKSRTNY